ncbi:MAG: isoprenylcysteine carboxylmethyltransferase family protein [Chitinophaga sp.]|uniref:methyltransferase family protein n=1 Tax=Chitinophaga sp. TaxID=1869181 RepID=UPI0025BD0BD1|nr:isoprenylcysteine carboxylmethyltransferase family protein [Chitinophaga sp.]MBV8253123.1 isoprenylcysteine carboxylmethyltransferase family protein [Chitinophaga sp.]
MKPSLPLFLKVSMMLTSFYLVLLLALFLPAQTWHYHYGWMYFITFVLGTSILTFYFLKVNPALIERRTQVEKEAAQILIQALNGLSFIVLLILPGLDFRNHWSVVPEWMAIAADILVAVGFIIVFMVFKQNSYLASNIGTSPGQTVVSDGLYGLVRHPMYSGAYLIILFTPFALGSYWALIPAFIIAILIYLRAKNEEMVLSRDLAGYDAYLQKVRYRFVPYIF